MSQTKRGLIVFVTVVLTLVLWIPVSSMGRKNVETGGFSSRLRLGLLGYGMVAGEFVEPEYDINTSINRERLALTIGTTGALWLMVWWILRRGGKEEVPAE